MKDLKLFILKAVTWVATCGLIVIVYRYVDAQLR